MATCRWVIGRVDAVSLLPDGDHRIGLETGRSGHAVVTILSGQRLGVPGVGERIAAIGTVLQPDGVRRWEPVWAIDYLDRGRTERALPPRRSLLHRGTVCVPGVTHVCAKLPTPVPSVSAAIPAVP